LISSYRQGAELEALGNAQGEFEWMQVAAEMKAESAAQRKHLILDDRLRTSLPGNGHSDGALVTTKHSGHCNRAAMNVDPVHLE